MSDLFDGLTFNATLDTARLTGQLERVYLLMLDGNFRTLAEIREVVGGSEAGVSARLRDLRKEKFGSHQIGRKRRGDPRRGLFEYAIATPVPLAQVQP